MKKKHLIFLVPERDVNKKPDVIKNLESQISRFNDKELFTVQDFIDSGYECFNLRIVDDYGETINVKLCDDYIQEYVDQYNLGNLITTIIVDYIRTEEEEIKYQNILLLTGDENFSSKKAGASKIKLNSLGEISPTKIKNSWNESELIQKLQNCWSDSAYNNVLFRSGKKYITFSEWLDKNF